MSTRSGIGVDVHPLVDGITLVLGGVVIPFDKGLSGHSDGDVLVHAVIDAVLGGVGLGDIGQMIHRSTPYIPQKFPSPYSPSYPPPTLQ